MVKYVKVIGIQRVEKADKSYVILHSVAKLDASRGTGYEVSRDFLPPYLVEGCEQYLDKKAVLSYEKQDDVYRLRHVLIVEDFSPDIA